jgi:hypothetical protein
VNVPVAALPSDRFEREQLLQDYFGTDQAVECDRRGEDWILRLTPPEDAAMYVDPRLSEGLEWWGLKRLTDIPTARRRLSTHLLALNDAWSLLSWSRWLVTQNPEGVRELLVLHVDDHEDLASPLLFFEAGALTDAITGKSVDLRIPESVESAIMSGAIGMGSFITPLLATVPTVHIRHLSSRPSPQHPGSWSISAATRPDTLIAPGRQRLKCSWKDPGHPPTGSSTYQVSASTSEWVRDLPTCPVLLHIDLDYFSNRFDGDSAWQTRSRRHDPPIEEVLAAVGQTVDAIEAALTRRVDDVSVGICPGFFPAELWAPTCEALSTRLAASPLVRP